MAYGPLKSYLRCSFTSPVFMRRCTMEIPRAKLERFLVMFQANHESRLHGKGATFFLSLLDSVPLVISSRSEYTPLQIVEPIKIKDIGSFGIVTIIGFKASQSRYRASFPSILQWCEHT